MSKYKKDSSSITKQRILDAAINIFAYDGYPTLLKISESGCISKASLHYHFSSRDHIYIEALKFARKNLDRADCVSMLVREHLNNRDLKKALKELGEYFE